MDQRAQASIARRGAALALTGLALACARPIMATASVRPSRGTVCDATELPRAPASPELVALPEDGVRVERISVAGTVRVRAASVAAVIQQRTGAIFDRERVAADVLAIWALEVFDDVRVRWVPAGDGIELVYEVRERPVVGRVIARGRAPHRIELGVEAGRLYEPERIQRRAVELEQRLIDTGHRRARVAVTGRSRGDRVDLCVEVVPGPRVLIDRLEIAGNSRLSSDAIRAELSTEEGRINAPGGVYRPDVLADDVLRISGAYYDLGMLDAHVEPRVRETAHAIRVTIEIEEGPVYRIGKLELRGPGRAGSGRRRELLGLRSGEVFSRRRFLEGIARIEAHERGEISIEPKTVLHRERGLVDVTLELSPR